MKRSSKILVGLGIAALLLAVATPALAQCVPAREFGAQGQGGDTARIAVQTAGILATDGITEVECPNDGNEFGTVYVPSNTVHNTGGPFWGTADTCPVGNWWLTGGMFLGVNSGIQEVIGGSTCTINGGCPTNLPALQTIVEDVSADGTNACVIVYQVEGDNTALRWYDHGKTAGGVPGTATTHLMEVFPAVDVVSSSGPPPDTTTTQNYRDVVVNFHGFDLGAPTPASTGVSFYNIMYYHGPSDPGRLRSAYTPLRSVAYADAPILGDVIATVPCPTTTDDTFLVVGLEYAGGVSSMLVGKSSAVECDPTLAEPSQKPESVRPKTHQRRPTSRRGR